MDYNDLFSLFTRCVMRKHNTMSAFVIGETEQTRIFALYCSGVVNIA